MNYRNKLGVLLCLIGLMTALPAHAQGGIRADNFEYNTPRTHYYSIGDGDFFPGNNFHGYITGAVPRGTYITNAGDSSWLVAGLHLPDGAVVTELRAYVYDNHFVGANAGNLSIRIIRYRHADAAVVSDLASADSLGFTNAVRDFADTTIDNPVIDNQNYAYFVNVYSDHWPGDDTLRIISVVVTYTIAEAD